MDYKFLNRVVDQLVNETEINYDQYYVNSPFSPRLSSTIFFSLASLNFFALLTSPTLPLVPDLFIKHCKEVYGLNDDEVEYVWNEYRNIIKDKINNEK